MVNLVSEIEARQKEEGWSDRKVASKLGISPPLWRFLKKGKRKPSLLFLRGVVHGFPEYTADALFFLRSDTTNVLEAHTVIDPHHAPLDGRRTAKPPAKVSEATRGKRVPKSKGGDPV